MSRRQTIHELAETLAICCSDDTIADLIAATADEDDRITNYQFSLAEALFESLAELRPDCLKLASNRLRKRTWLEWLMGLPVN